MVVDDDELVARVVARQVRALGYVVDLACDVTKAFALAAAYDYSVVLTDLLMPDMSGIELMAALAEKSDATAFVLMTGAGDLSHHDSRVVDGRLTTVVSKPLRDDELSLALFQAFEVADKRRSPSVRALSGIRLLLVEDSPSDAFLTKQSLQILGGYEVTHAVRLAEAVELLHETTFDTVITDLTLPDARGLGAVLRLRESAPDATLIVCSSVADEVMALQVVELGAQDFIVKGGGDVETLGRTIRFARVRRQAERRLARLAHTDTLTGLANRSAFNERLDQALALAKRQQAKLGVVYLDLDGFKAVNDTHGHDAGDALLQQVATRVRRCIRDYDVVARLGGDEFAILATNLAPGSLNIAANGSCAPSPCRSSSCPSSAPQP